MHAHTRTHHTTLIAWTLAAGSAIRYAKSTSEGSKNRGYIVCKVVYSKFREYGFLNHLFICNLSFEHTIPSLWCLCLHSCIECSGCLQVAVYWSAMLILLAISCNIRQHKLALTSLLYRCNSMGASMPLLDNRERVTAYANFTFSSTLPKQTRHPFQNSCVCVHVCVQVRVSYANGLHASPRQSKVIGVTHKSRRFWNSDRPHLACSAQIQARDEKIVVGVFLDPTSLMFTHLHFYRRDLEVENTWLLSLSLVFTEAFALFFRLCSACYTVSLPSIQGALMISSTTQLWLPLFHFFLFAPSFFFLNWHFSVSVKKSRCKCLFTLGKNHWLAFWICGQTTACEFLFADQTLSYWSV